MSSRIFANNLNIEVFDFFGIRINAIEINFFDNFDNVRIVNGMFYVNDENPIETIIPEFETCFKNLDIIDAETETLSMELRRSLVIRGQDGEEVVRLETGNKTRSFAVSKLH